MKTTLFTIAVLFFTVVHALFAQQAKPLYQSENLEIRQVSAHAFVHVSYLKTEDFGKVACNGMIVVDGGEALVFDTPTDDAGSRELLGWLEKRGVKVKGVVATHFHDDCVGGLEAFHALEIPSYGSFKTIELATAEGNLVPQNGFQAELDLDVGELSVSNRFFGEGHTRDNVVAYLPADGVLFGGCMVKELGAGVGYLGDANTAAWPETVTCVKTAFPDLKLVIPGHGKEGDVALLDYTVRLFEAR
ncbi:subclass B1 metallo-beta-lactamase [Algoriphagus sp. H41]|uniref:beta-lactamase n=1 Tax=Algoriphagus oliviformis TaxID=2811231 RepID=A0ABS3C254_9BACT|nr:subclass B1 metallo-beta-lactamase [Algoriphagus oliviformis]MBN7811190.1 subclass B1 metallo-beta-lactamase [Algoriphagus oliviformis]